MRQIRRALNRFKKPRTKTSHSQEFLNNIRIAAPCQVSWESMTGDDQVRFCGSCEKNVFDISTLSANAAADLIKEKQGNICIQLYRRPDGTVLTEDCPKGLKRLKQAMNRRVACIVAALGWLGFTGSAGAQSVADAPTTKNPASCSRARGTVLVKPAKTQLVDAEPPAYAERGELPPYTTAIDGIDSTQVCLVRPDSHADRLRHFFRIILGIALVGGALYSWKHLRRKPMWVTALAVVSVCAIIGFTWM